MKHRFYVVEIGKWEPLLGPYSKASEAELAKYGSDGHLKLQLTVLSRTDLRYVVVRGEYPYPRGKAGEEAIEQALKKNKGKIGRYGRSWIGFPMV